MTRAFIISAACAGLGGGVLALVLQLAAPGSFQLPLSLYLLAGVVIGGLGSLWGTLVGGIALGLAQTVGAQAFGAEWSIFCGHALFLLVLAFRSQGIFAAREARV